MTRVLLIEDDAVTARWAEGALREAGHDVEVAYRGDDGLRLATEGSHALVIVDIGLPGKSGLAVVQALRASGRTVPIIAMTGNPTDEVLVAALHSGADDFVVKPISAKVLQARALAALRRGGPTQGHLLHAGRVTMDRIARRVHVESDGSAPNGLSREVALTGREFSLLEHLMQRAGEIVGRSDLHEQVWGLQFDPGTNVVDATMSRLRSKIGPVPGFEIASVRGVGYRLTGGEDAIG